MKSEVAAGLRAVLDAPDRGEAERRLALLADSYRKKAPKLAEWLEQNVPDSFTVFQFPEQQRRRLRTSN